MKHVQSSLEHTHLIVLKTVSRNFEGANSEIRLNMDRRNICRPFKKNKLITWKANLRLHGRDRKAAKMNIEKTFVMLKPSTIARAMIGSVVSRIENKGLKIVALKLTWVTQEEAAKLYAIHKRKPFYEELTKFITSSPIVAIVIEGDEAVKVTRKLIGATNAKEAEPGTIRGDFALSNQKNAIHASDSAENAKYEMDIFFESKEIVSYKRADEDWVY